MRWQIVAVLRVRTVLQMPCDVEWHLGAFPASCNKCASPCSYQLDSHHFGHVRSRKWRLTVSPTVGSGQPREDVGPVAAPGNQRTLSTDALATPASSEIIFVSSRGVNVGCHVTNLVYFFSLLTLSSEFIIR